MYERSRSSSYEAWKNIQSSLENLVSERTETLNIEIDKRKRREEELHGSEQRLSLALKGAKCGLWDWDIKRNTIHFDDNYYLISSYQPDDFPQTYEEWENRLHSDDIDSAKEALQSYLKGKTQVFSMEFRFKRKDNTWIWILGQGKIIEWSDDGQAIRLSGLHIDINDRKQAELEQLILEKQLQQKHKIEAIGTMAGGIAHNFNNLLAIILGSLEMAQRKIHEPDKLRQYLKNANTATLRSRDLVMQIMIYSRKGLQTLAPTQLHSVVEKTLALLHPTTPETVELSYQILPESKNIYCQADSSRIQEALFNLYSNAVDAMDKKGTISIYLDQVELSQEEIPKEYHCSAGTYAHLTVQDTGCGMYQETIDKIFDPFFTTKEVNNGTGMGLSTVQGIMDQLSGLINVQSTPGQGSRFELYFPVTPREKDDPPDKDQSLSTKI